MYNVGVCGKGRFMDIGDRIRQLREEKGMTLEELGNKVGVGKSTVRKWEIGMIENMRRDKIAKVAAALDVTPDYLIGWNDSDKNYEVLIETYKMRHRLDYLLDYYELLAKPEIRAIIQCLATCDELQIKVVRDLVSTLAVKNMHNQEEKDNGST